jgi:predicted amidohydrolase
MTANKSFKRRVRSRAARTGESYQAAYHRLLSRTEESMTVTEEESVLKVALNAMAVGPWLPTAASLAAQGDRIIERVAESARGEARLALFAEGALVSPHKRQMSRSAPELDEADWSKVEWEALRTQLVRIAAAAREHRIWVVVGAVHDLGEGRRPHNCLYVISDQGELVTRYDKRRLSTTEITYMYTPGTEPVTFDVDGVRVGLAIGLEVLFPDLFTAYSDEGADLVVAASHSGGIFEQLVTSYALITQMPIALVIPPTEGDASHTGVYGPSGTIGTIPEAGEPGIVFTEIGRRDPASTFHYKARHGFYDDRVLDGEPRSLTRTTF